MKSCRFMAMVFIVFCLAVPAWAAVYVDGNNTGTEDGTSWSTAYNTVQEGVDAASAAGGGDVWVAAGTYAVYNSTDGVYSTVQMKSNVNIYGGFAGTETRLDQRDWETNVTTLDGESAVKHVVTGASNAIIDGFTVTGGKAQVQKKRSPAPRAGTTVDSILENADETSGGGILIFQTAPTVQNCIFDGNQAIKGGGAYIMVSTTGSTDPNDAETAPTFTNCTFSNNYAKTRGGGVALDVNSHPTFTNCVFKNNSCDAKGGAMYNDWGCSPTLINCLIVKNEAARAAAMGNDGASSPILINCTVSDNYAYDIGAGIFTGSVLNSSNDPTLINCIVWGNENQYGGPTDLNGWHENHFYISYSVIGTGFYSYGTEILYDQDPLFVDPDNGDYTLQSGSPCIDKGADATYNASVPSDDIDGNARDGSPDMGAYEYVVTQTGTLAVSISPAEAVIAGAQWSVDSGATWHDDGATQTLDAGTYNVTYSTLNGYTSPSSASVTIVADGSETISATYTDEKTYPDAFKGYTLHNPFSGTVVYLMDNYGNTVQSWDAGYRSALSVYLMENGNLLQTVNMNNTTFDEAGAGGRVIEVNPDGNIEWSYDYSSSEYVLHHDVEVMDSGNILMIAWDFKSYTEAVAAGRNPSNVAASTGLYPDAIIEVDPDTDEIVWEWHVWDHLVQDYDSSKENYGTVADHPELIDLNFVDTNPDLTHFNSIDYNEEFDQILVSVKRYNEIWVIDHSTTTAEAATHSSGTYGKGGDLLYRWGNPEAYGAGDSTDQMLFGQHDANWIDSGYPGEGNILIFNNGEFRTGGTNYSSIEEITPPVDASGNYSLTTGSAYEPSTTTWTYNIDSTYYSFNISGVQRLPNGNTLICSGANGYFLEVDSDDNAVWSYTVDDNATNVFKIRRYGVDYAGLSALMDTGTITVTLNASGAQWNINDGEWHDSGETVTVAAGTHTIGYSEMDGYDAPANQDVTVSASGSESISVAYTEQSGYISVSFTPSDIGSQWSVDGGTTWYDSGTQSFDAGTYTVTFSDVLGFVKPNDQTVTVTAGATESVEAIYTVVDQTTGLFTDSTDADDGHILYSPTEGDGSYLMDRDGTTQQQWGESAPTVRSTPRQETGSKPLPVVYLLENGNLLRTSAPPMPNANFIADGTGGMIQEFDANNNVIWSYTLSTDTQCLHHDIKPMPNGNILMAVWDRKTNAEAIAAGRNPDTLPASDGLWPDKIIEVQPDRTNGGGTIVWEWHVWDHLIQDFDPGKPNYGIVADHPELINVNYFYTITPTSDWTHVNAIDYRADLDQILISAHGFNEVWVIDHGTTSEEAAGHVGGTYGKGGDLLYRWGNPAAYDAPGENQLFAQHDANWIEPGDPGEYNILIFDNGEADLNGDTYSSVKEIIPPMDANGNYLMTGSLFGPQEPAWTYTNPEPVGSFAGTYSSAQRLPNGNTLICNGAMGIFFEVTPDANVVWKYVNPITGDAIVGTKEAIPEKDGIRQNQVYKIHRYAQDYAGLPDNIRLDLSGVIKILQLLTGIEPAAGSEFFDADKDGRAELGDALHIMRMVGSVQ